MYCIYIPSFAYRLVGIPSSCYTPFRPLLHAPPKTALTCTR